jgi:hypothetical protein
MKWPERPPPAAFLTVCRHRGELLEHGCRRSPRAETTLDPEIFGNQMVRRICYRSEAEKGFALGSPLYPDEGSSEVFSGLPPIHMPFFFEAAILSRMEAADQTGVGPGPLGQTVPNPRCLVKVLSCD